MKVDHSRDLTLKQSASPTSKLSSRDTIEHQRVRAIYLHTRVFYVGEIDLRSQSFGCSFDLYVGWDPKDAPTPDFVPIIRFPEAVTAHEILRLDISDDHRVGYRTTIEGRFRSKMVC